jgi:hypothetical protein
MTSINITATNTPVTVNITTPQEISVTPVTDVVITPFEYNVLNYQAIGDGTTDDTVAIQAAIDAAELTGGKVFLPHGTYKITDTLVIGASITFEGEGVHAQYGSMDDAESRIIGVEIPTQSPYLTGSVLIMHTAATDAIKITVVGKSVHLKNFGIKFADAIRFTNTGHGINLLPATNAIDNLPDFGIFDSLWENVFVWGHDGTHYAFRLVNMVLSTFTNLRSYGGGGIEMHANTNMDAPGNCVFINPYIVLFCGNTAQGIYIHKSGNNNGCILNTFLRPQVNFIEAPVEFTGITAVVTATQYIFNCDIYTVKLNLISPNFETTIGGGWLINSAQYAIYPAGGSISYCHTPYGDWRSDGMRLYDDNGAILAALYTNQLIIKSPNGSYHSITVSNDNVISSVTL